jgi:hypothetical protein
MDNSNNKKNIKIKKNSPRKKNIDKIRILEDNQIKKINSPKNNVAEKNNNDIDNNIFLKELLTKQLKNVNITKKLNYSDIKRICRFINTSLFDENKCTLWNGYITNENNNAKGTYINFYFNKKKIALHRLLYINYIENLNDDEYIKYTCQNKGKCCNVYHMKKYIYTKSNTLSKQNEEITQDNNNDMIQINTDKNKLIIEL